MSDDVAKYLQDKIDDEFGDFELFFYRLNGSLGAVEIDGEAVEHVESFDNHKGYSDYEMAYVIKFRDRYFARQGRRDSWGGETWYGDLVEVEKRPVVLSNWVPLGKGNAAVYEDPKMWYYSGDSWGSTTNGDSWS